jgi:hypothetical protein
MPDPNYSDSNEFISVLEAERRLGVHYFEVMALIEAGELPWEKHRLWPCLRVSAEVVDEYRQRHSA